MKQRDLIKLLKENGFQLDRNGGNHDIYVKENKQIAVPRHKEINELLARSILKEAGIG